jgi:hypothetical protein
VAVVGVVKVAAIRTILICVAAEDVAAPPRDSA